MTRQQKYPDTETFHFHNANPNGKYTGDCVARALSVATGNPYSDIVRCLAEIQIATGYDGTSPEGFGRYLESEGWIKHKQPRMKSGRKYTGEVFCIAQQSLLFRDGAEGLDVYPSKRIVANIGGGHTVAIIDGKVWDTWDSTEGCIGNYWTKAI